MITHSAWDNDQRLYIATDGGSNFDCASWAVAIAAGEDLCCSAPLARFGKPMIGEDFSPFTAELEALRQAVHLAIAATLAYGKDGPKPLTFIIDCLSAITFVEKKSPPDDRVLFWKDIRSMLDLLRQLGCNSELVWCPSHGKHEEWVAPPYTTANRCRSLNDAADASATTALEAGIHDRGIRQWFALHDAAETWATKAIRYAINISDDVREYVLRQLNTRERYGISRDASTSLEVADDDLPGHPSPEGGPRTSH